MSEETRVFDQDELLEGVRSRTIAGLVRVRLPGGEVPIRYEQRHSSTLIISFAGAINRQVRSLPVFEGTGVGRYVACNILGIADPSLERSPHLTAAWYSGHEGFELQKLLPDFLGKFAEASGAKRVIYFGGSAGGFAALYYSWHAPGSVALVTNPQTNLDRFSEEHLIRYRMHGWPTLDSGQTLSEVITSDLAPRYSHLFENTVIYLQNATDYGHVRLHMAPFISSIRPENQHRLIPRLGYWGKKGHSLIPPAEWLLWLSAAMNASSPDAEEILELRHEFEVNTSVPSASKRQVSTEDVRLAATLAVSARTGTTRT